MTAPSERDNGRNATFFEPNTSGVDMASENRAVSQRFTQFYIGRGYQYVEPGGILPEDDKTVIFTGATITPLKRFLHEGVPQPGLTMVQKCLRVKRLDEMFDVNKYPDWTHYFTMCGILSAPERIGEVTGEAYDLLIDELNVQPENLLIEASSRDKDLSNHWIKKGVEVEEDTHPEGYYRWQYGIPNIHGRGINILLRHDLKDTYRDLGNVVSVEDDGGSTIAYEFGFGLESLLSKKHGFKKPMEASIACSVIKYEEGAKEKLINALVAAIVIYHHGVEPGKGKEKHVLKKLIKGISFLRRQMDLSLDRLKKYGEVFELAEFEESYNSGEKLIGGIIDYEKQLAKYIDYARNQSHAHRLRGDVNNRLHQKVVRMGNVMGISPVDVDQVVRSIIT